VSLPGSVGRYPRPTAITTASAVPVNSQGAAVPSMTSTPSAAMKPPAAVSAWAHTAPARNNSGGQITTVRSPLLFV